jgi:hypothetical protein
LAEPAPRLPLVKALRPYHARQRDECRVRIDTAARLQQRFYRIARATLFSQQLA